LTLVHFHQRNSSNRLLSLLQKLSHYTGLDRAIGFTVLARSWSILSGVVTLVFVARYLSPKEQGYYYTFASLVSLQTVFELGFSFVILQLAAHERAHLTIDGNGTISGSDTAHLRLASILVKATRWYSVAAGIMATALLAAGFWFFSTHRQSAPSVSWELPWICVVIATVFTFQLDPIFSFMEGCGFVADVARMRLGQAILGTTLAWTALTVHRGLFAPASIIMGQAIAGFIFLYSKRRLLIPLIRIKTKGHVVRWRTEIWPFQWRMAISFLCSCFIFPLFNPVLFAFRGPAEAGRMGMSLSIATALGTVAFSWINTKSAPFGNLIARQDFDALDRLFSRTLVQSASLLLIADLIVLSGIAIIQRTTLQLAGRMLPLPQFGILLATAFLTHFLYSEAIYLRAHKREPFLSLSISVALLTAASTIVGARFFGAAGVTVGYFLFGGVLNLTGGSLIFVQRRRLWHRPGAGLAEAADASKEQASDVRSLMT
jgi:hypothetical protein